MTQTANPNTESGTDRDTTSPALVDVQIVASMLDCSSRHVYRLTDAGRMPAPVRLGSLVRWRRVDVEAWIAAGCRAVVGNAANADGGAV